MSLAGAFADPVLEAQGCFRSVLDAMARPGRLHHVAPTFAPSRPLDPATAAVLLTLVDHETPLWLDTDALAAHTWIAFHCGAPLVDDPKAAAFAIASAMPELEQLRAGTHEMPEHAATLVLQVRALGQGGAAYRLMGPGLREPQLLRVDGLPADFADAWARNHARFPCGIDLILCAGTQLTALPRSVSVRGA